jgi:hypothetical protein
MFGKYIVQSKGLRVFFHKVQLWCQGDHGRDSEDHITQLRIVLLLQRPANRIAQVREPHCRLDTVRLQKKRTQQYDTRQMKSPAEYLYQK